MATKNKMLLAAAGNTGGGEANVEDLFSTYLYEGNGSTQTITNDIDLAGKGGMVWTKERESGATYPGHKIVDTVRGVRKTLYPEQDQIELDRSSITAFSSDGFTLGDYLTGNQSGIDNVSWTFRKAPKFFDVVTYTGTGSAQTISHNLGAEVGCIIVKNLDSLESWQVYHRSRGATKFLLLDSDQAEFTASSRWNNTAPTSTEFTVNTDEGVNELGSTHVAYLFAHNDGDGDFGPDGDQDIIKCGTWTGNGSVQEVDLGFEPQWVLYKRTDGTGNWIIVDVMRGLVVGDDAFLRVNTNGAEGTGIDLIDPTARGFKTIEPTGLNASGRDFMYIAIRRGTKVPESGAEVFAMDQKTTQGDGDYAIPVTLGKPLDFVFIKMMTSGSWRASNRLIGAHKALYFNVSNAEHSLTDPTRNYYDSNTTAAVQATVASGLHQAWGLRRAPKFLDLVAYTGNGSVRTEKHNLGVAPEMIWVKSRSEAFVEDWRTYHKDLTSADYYLQLNSTAGEIVGNTTWNQTAPTADVFTIGSGSTVNKSGGKYIAYLFASLDGVSKVGSYTGNGTSQTIDCGFTTGARFVLVKQTTVTSTGMDWYVYDTERGIVVGNDKRLSLNTTAAEITADDVYPDASGFGVTGTNTPNTNGETYIFYAIA